MTYHPKLHPKLILWIARWGTTDAEIATELEITTDVLAQWSKDHKEVAEAIAAGRNYWQTLAENSLQKLLKGYEYEETEVVADGEGHAKSVRRTRRHMPPNAQAVIFQIQNQPIFDMIKKATKGIPLK